MADAVIYDLRGLKCPLPVLKTRRRMADLNPGDELIVETTDPLAGIDIPHFCNEDGHELLTQERLDNSGHRFHIRKGGDRD
jgi:tRNA 2-thiouridine synthesizing protein A